MSKGIIEKLIRLTDNIELLDKKDIQAGIDEVLVDLMGDEPIEDNTKLETMQTIQNITQ